MTVTTHDAKTTKLIRILLVGLLLSIWAGMPGALYSAPAATAWYVAAGVGSDSNTCTTAAHPCEHIQTAINRAHSGDTINIAAGTYLQELSITDKNLTLKGQGAASTLLDGNQSFPILSIFRSSVSSLTVNVSGVTLQNGKSGQPGGAMAIEAQCAVTLSDSVIAGNITSSSGGGISNQGTLKLINVTVRANSATGFSAEGGGIYNTGNLELSRVLLIDNQAPSGAGISNRNTLTVTASSIISNTSSGLGGGIYNVTENSRLRLLNSTLSDNASFAGSGGAIYNTGSLSSTNTIIFGNDAAQYAGGIYNDTSGQATLTGGSIRSNTSAFAGGGLFNGGIARLDAALITDNKANTTGGGIHNAANGKLTLGTSAVITNTASGGAGGGINNLGTLTLTQSALVYNGAANSQGGGLNNGGNAQLTNVTVSDNTALSGGGIYNTGSALTLQFSTMSYNSAPALVRASGSVIAGNSILAQNVGSVCSAPITSANYNIDTGTSCGFGSANDLSNTNPQLGPLQDNGGGTITRAIAFSSAGVDSANDGTCPPNDQRGVRRPQSDHCDRGAYEAVGYNNPNALDIGAHQCVISTLTTNDNFYVGRMQVGVNLTYSPSRSDLTIRLLSPGSPKAGLLGPAANSGQNLDTLFDDTAPTVVPAGNQDPGVPFYTPSYKPSTPLTQLRGTNIKGAWKLEICNAGTGTGTLNRWVLVVPEFFNFFKIYLPLIKR